MNYDKISVSEALQKGISAHKAGNVQEAEYFYRVILQEIPSHSDANHNLGILAISANQLDVALALLKKAVKSNPKVEQYWASYIEVLMAAGDLPGAQYAVGKCTESGVTGKKIDVLQARLNKDASKKEEAVDPPHEVLNRLLDLYQSGSHKAAMELSLSTSRNFPQHPFAWKVLGALQSSQGLKLEALAAKQHVVKLAPDDFHAHNNLGVTFNDLQKFEEAIASYKRAITLNPGYAEAYCNLGNTLKELGRLDEAKSSFTKSIELSPSLAEAHHNLGGTFQELGDFEHAETCYRKAIELRPDYGEAFRQLSSIKKFEKSDPQFIEMQKIVTDKRVKEEQLCHINFALGKAYEDLSYFDKAFKSYAIGNKLRKKHLEYKIDRDIEMFSRLKSSYPRLSETRIKANPISSAPLPVFIVGMPRSGTTLIEQIVSSHSQISGGGELSLVSEMGGALAEGFAGPKPEALLRFREEYLKSVSVIADRNPIVTDKMPHNFLYLGLITTVFPDAKIVHVVRNPPAVCWSNYKQYFESKSIGYCYSLDDLVRYYSLYKDLMSFWKNSFPERIYTVDYDVLTDKQENETKKLIQYLGVNWEAECLLPQENNRSVATASNTQVRQSVYRGSSEYWKRFRPYLKGAFDDLDDLAEYT